MLAGCGVLGGTPAPRGADALISVLLDVTGGSEPGTALSLEIGRAAWSARSDEPGMAALSAPDAQRVRLIRVDDCEVLAEFTADPGTAHVIRLQPDGEAVVEDRTAADAAADPLEPADPVDCP